jgi:hypothetical protein
MFHNKSLNCLNLGSIFHFKLCFNWHPYMIIYVGIFKKLVAHIQKCENLQKQNCRNPSFGLATKSKVCKVVSQNWAQKSHFMLLGVQESVREWTPTLPSELPFCELKSQWTPKFLEGNCKGQNSFDWKVLYIIEKLLELKYLKWVRMTHLGT